MFLAAFEQFCMDKGDEFPEHDETIGFIYQAAEIDVDEGNNVIEVVNKAIVQILILTGGSDV